METIGLGTELKLNLNIEPLGEITMDDYYFEVDIYCSLKRIGEKRPFKKRKSTKRH